MLQTSWLKQPVGTLPTSGHRPYTAVRVPLPALFAAPKNLSHGVAHDISMQGPRRSLAAWVLAPLRLLANMAALGYRRLRELFAAYRPRPAVAKNPGT
jgi:hypothetical protein